MTRIRRINVSQVEGGGADNTDINEIRPNGETAFYLDNNNKLTMMMFDGVRTHLKSKVLSPGMLFGSNADAGDGSGADTIKLIPDANLHLNNGNYGNNQHIVIDPTGPNHIHLRAGGTIDNSDVELYLGGEQTFVRVSDNTDDVVIRTSVLGEGITQYTWLFDNTGKTTFPGGMAITGVGATVQANSGNDINIETNDLQTVSANCAIAVGSEFVADIEFNDDITVVQVGWTVAIDFATYVVTSIDPAPPANQYRITATGATFVQGVSYTFTNPTPVTKTWSFGSTGILTTPGNGTISHQNNDLKIEVTGTDVVVLRTAGGDVVVTSSGDLQLDGNITAGSIKGTDVLGGEVVISTASAQGDSAKNWTFSHDGVGDLGLPQESGVSAIKSMNLSTYSPTFQQFVNLKDYDSLSSVDGTDINIINPQPEILALIDPTSPNFIGTAGAKVRIVHGYSLGDFIVTETTLTGSFALNGEDPLVPGVPRYTATIADTGVAASEIRQFGFGDSATWHFKSNGSLKLPTGGVLGYEGMGWPGFSNGTSQLPVSVMYKDNTGYPQSAITFSGGNNVDGEGSIIIDAYNANTTTGYQWAFDSNGTLMLPGGMTIDTEYGGTARLVIDGKNNGVDIRSNGNILIGYNSSGNVYIGNPNGGDQVDIVGSRFRVLVNTPTHSTGSAGDQVGQVAMDSSYIYYCFANFGTAPTETFTVLNSGESNNLIRVSMAANPNYTVPTAGWYVTIGGVLMTLSAFSAPSGSEYHFLFDNASGSNLPSTVTLTSPTGYTNIWKRVAWSGDTW